MARRATLLLLCLLAARGARGEATLFTVSYGSRPADVGGLDAALRAAGRPALGSALPSRLSATADLLWVVPAARWLWLNAGYGYFAADSGDGARFRLHAVEVGPSLYADLLPAVVYLGLGGLLLRPEFEDRTGALSGARDAAWRLGAQGQIGATCPLWHRVGLHGRLGYRWARAVRPGGRVVPLEGLCWRVGLAWIPDEDSWLLTRW